MIVNLPATIALEMQQSLNLDTLLDFVAEHVTEADLYHFKDVASILSWLYAAEAQWLDDQCHVNANESQQCNNDVTISHALKPGIKVTIPKPGANDIKFTDMESVQAYLNQGAANLSNDDFEEVDVTTFDYTPTWNHYHITDSSPENQKTKKILTELQTNVKTKPPKKSANKMDLVEIMYKCDECDKKYKQKSSLLRHSKIHLPKEPGTEIPVKKSKKKRSNKKSMNGDTHAILPLKNIESIPT